MTCRVRRDGSTLSGERILLFSSFSTLSISLMPLHPSVEPTFPMRRSPRMIPSRTVFNHCKWIYIELAITGAHSGMGPLCISSAPDTSRQSPGECFPHFIPPYRRLQPLDSRNRLSCSQPCNPLPSSSVLSISFCPALSRFISFSLFYFPPPLIPYLRSLSLSLSSLRFKDHASPHSFSISLSLFLAPFSRFSLRRKPSLFCCSFLFLSFFSFLFFASSFLDFRPILCSRPFENGRSNTDTLVSVFHSRKTRENVLFHLTATYPAEGRKFTLIFRPHRSYVLSGPRNCSVRLLASTWISRVRISTRS